LQEIHGKNYQDFILRKLIPVVGDVREARMGIDAALADEIAEEVDVIVNSAANTTFDERYFHVLLFLLFAEHFFVIMFYDALVLDEKFAGMMSHWT